MVNPFGKELTMFRACAVIAAMLLLVASSYAQNVSSDAAKPGSGSIAPSAGGVVAPPETGGPNAIRPFHFNASEDALTDLRRRVAATQWPEKEAVTDASQGVQLATMQKLA